jgi:flagellar protein FliT
LEASNPVASSEAIQPGWRGLVSAVREVYQLTIKLIEFLESANEDRNEKIQRVEALLAQREVFLNELNSPYTSDEMELGQKLIQMNTKLLNLLNAEKNAIQKDIKGLMAKKESNTKYVNPYQSLATDGMFYDKRK